MQGPADVVELPHLIPAIVYRAFTIELLLKSLLLREHGSAPALHRFTELFAPLSEASKAEIEATFEKLANRSQIFQVLAAHTQRPLKFHDVLEAMDRSFEKWRYAFDADIQGAYGLEEIEQAIRNRFSNLDSL